MDWDNRGAGNAAIKLDAGRAIVQACTFEQEGPHVQIEKPVKSALLVGNQASGGFVAENNAGNRTQLAANESSSWTDEAKKYYRVVVGAEGDGQFLRRWHGRDAGFRWSTTESQLRLPVVPNARYTLTLKLNVPKQAVSPNAGLYLDDKRLASFEAGNKTLNVELPPSRTGQIILKVVCAGWVPVHLNHASSDDRTLGLQLSEVTMQAKTAGRRLFHMNTGEWVLPQ